MSKLESVQIVIMLQISTYFIYYFKRNKTIYWGRQDVI